jgi:Luciferase-like monooxygenase
MKIGMLCLCTAGAGAKDTADPVTLARKCESLGFESFFLSEHPIFPVDVRTPHPVLPTIPESYAYFPDPFVCLAMAAQATSRLKVGAGVILVPERDPIVTAKEVASLDHYCGGRFIFGVGAGWVREETLVMGIDFEQRWPITCEYPGNEGAMDQGRSQLRRRMVQIPARALISKAPAKTASADSDWRPRQSRTQKCYRGR